MKNKKLIQFVGTSFLFLIFLFMFHMFLTAYSNPSKSVNIFIDNYGEAFIECWIMMPMLFFLGLITLYFSYKDYKQESNQQNKNPRLLHPLEPFNQNRG